MLFAGFGSVRIVLENAENAALGHSFSPYGPPSRQITYINYKIYLPDTLVWKTNPPRLEEKK